jgi:antitoxin component of MazEF toxin-antitoxin module
VRLPAAISREAGLQANQTVALSVVAEGVLIRPVEPRPHPIGRLDTNELELVRSIVEHPWHKSADSPP